MDSFVITGLFWLYESYQKKLLRLTISIYALGMINEKTSYLEWQIPNKTVSGRTELESGRNFSAVGWNLQDHITSTVGAQIRKKSAKIAIYLKSSYNIHQKASQGCWPKTLGYHHKAKIGSINHAD